MKKPIVSIVVAISAGRRAMGNKGKLLWHIPDDLKRFKKLTLGHPVVMGSKTFESILNILGRPLPGRTSIVMTRDTAYKARGCVIVHSLEDAFQKAQGIEREEIFIGGGGEIYSLALPLTDKLYVTLVQDEPSADSFFPDYSEFTKKTFEEKREYEGLQYTWINLERE
jgi:dihydrofolate reductase